ncbi:MAG: bifunctional 4-hydroxy-2-oxoglutarate aldolase/2-dehydro-3-deoxy-phosphogluconate aldolase [Nonlabens sp.]|nr:bifunctional 4-hydroxy-2-oxoglutarate aldolase/2-dehydro-3-deoxy-phosphogluconate aldolase [Nonlabens sp.]
MNTNTFLNTVQNHKVVPVFFHKDPAVVLQVIEASYNGGVRIFEFVNRGNNGLDTFEHIVKELHRFPELTLGIGTIYDAKTAKEFLDAGAQFVVSPCFVEEVALLCNDHDTIYLPGIATIKEAFTASQYGCKVIKIFPASVIGSAFAKALKSVLPALEMMPTGGIEPTKEGMEEWIQAGVCCIGMGSQLFDKSKISSGAYQELSADIATSIKNMQELTNQ